MKKPLYEKKFKKKKDAKKLTLQERLESKLEALNLGGHTLDVENVDHEEYRNVNVCFINQKVIENVLYFKPVEKL